MQTYKLKQWMISLISLFYKFCEHSLLPGTVQGTQRRSKSVPSSEHSCLFHPKMTLHDSTPACFHGAMGTVLTGKGYSLSNIYLPVQT